jgi:hypothetical protein
MAAPAGLSGQFGIKTESVVGTAVTVDQFIPITSEGLAQDIPRIDSQGIMAGRYTISSWGTGATSVGGPVALELNNKKLATLLNHCFGAVATTGAGPYTHTLTPGTLLGKSFTAQAGRPDLAGTVQPFTYAGCKVNTWEVSAQDGQFATLSLDIVAMSEVTATSLATASYVSGFAPFTFVQGSITQAGSAASAIKSFSLKGDNALERRPRAGSASSKEPLPNNRRSYTGQLTADFESLTAYNRFVNGTETALVLAFSNGTDTLTFTANVRYDGATPTLAGLGMLEQSLPFTCISGTSDAAALTAVLVNSDTTAV